MLTVILRRKVGGGLPDVWFEREMRLPVCPLVGMRVVIGAKEHERRPLVQEVVLAADAPPVVTLEPDFGAYKSRDAREAHESACRRLEASGFRRDEPAPTRKKKAGTAE